MSETSTALATIDQNQAIMAGLGGDEVGFKPTDIELVQPIIAGEGLIAGRFRDKQSNMQFESIDLVPIEFSEGRVYFPPDESTSDKPICRSIDGRFPVTGKDNLVPQHDNCAKCPHAQWKKVKTQGGKIITVKPACSETMRFTFIEQFTDFVYRLNAKGMNLAPLKALRDTLKKLVKMSQVKGHLIPHFGFGLSMGSTKVQGKKGTFYVLKFGAPKPLEEPAQHYPAYERLVLRKGAEQEDVEPAEAAVDSAVEGEYVEA